MSATVYEKVVLLKRTIIILLLSFLGTQLVYAQKLGISNNIVYDATVTPNLSVEAALSPKWTVNVQFGMNSFLYEKNAVSSNYKNTKFSHWLAQPELRYWTCDVFNGWFLGLHVLGGQMNAGGINIPFVLQNKNREMKDHRYEGWFYGAGATVGYHWPISARLNIGAAFGFGYVRIDYNKFRCTTCGVKEGNGSADYIGPTRAELSIVYFLK